MVVLVAQGGEATADSGAAGAGAEGADAQRAGVAVPEPHRDDLAAELYLALRQPGRYMARAVNAAITSATDDFGDPVRWDRPSEWTARFVPVPVEGEETEEDDAASGLRGELESLRFVQLQGRVKKENLDHADVAAAMEATDPQQELITLLVAHYARQALIANMDSDEEDALALVEPEPEPEQDPYLEDAHYDGRSEMATKGLTALHVMVRDCADMSLIITALEAAGGRKDAVDGGLAPLLWEGGETIDGKPARWRPIHLAAHNRNIEVLRHLLQLERTHDEATGVTMARETVNAAREAVGRAKKAYEKAEAGGWKQKKAKKKNRGKLQVRRKKRAAYASNLKRKGKGKKKAQSKGRKKGNKSKSAAKALLQVALADGSVDKAETREIFRRFDADSSGELSTKELTKVVVSILQQLRDKLAADDPDVKAAFDEQIAHYNSPDGSAELSSGFDPDMDGSISEKEFSETFPGFIAHLTGQPPPNDENAVAEEETSTVTETDALTQKSVEDHSSAGDLDDVDAIEDQEDDDGVVDEATGQRPITPDMAVKFAQQNLQDACERRAQAAEHVLRQEECQAATQREVEQGHCHWVKADKARQQLAQAETKLAASIVTAEVRDAQLILTETKLSHSKADARSRDAELKAQEMNDIVATALRLPRLAQKSRKEATRAQTELKAAEMTREGAPSRPATSKSSSSQSGEQLSDDLWTAVERRKQFVATRLEGIKKLGVKKVKEQLTELGLSPIKGKVKKQKLVAALSDALVDKDIEQLRKTVEDTVQQALRDEDAASTCEPTKDLEERADSLQKEAESYRGLEHQEQQQVEAAIAQLGKFKRKKKAQDEIGRCDAALDRALASLMELKESAGCLEQTRARDACGNKALHYAARSNTNLDVLKLLMAVDLEQSNVSLATLDATQSDVLDSTVCGALNVKNGDGAQPLHLACENENVAIMMHIVSNKAKCVEVETRIRELVAKRWPWITKTKVPPQKTIGPSSTKLRRTFSSNVGRTRAKAGGKKYRKKRGGVATLKAALADDSIDEHETRKIFAKFDTDGSGELSSAELTKVVVGVLEALKQKFDPATKEEKRARSIDEKVHFEQGEKAFDEQIAHYQSEEGVAELSCGFDPDGDGSISETEFVDAFPGFMAHLVGDTEAEEEKAFEDQLTAPPEVIETKAERLAREEREKAQLEKEIWAAQVVQRRWRCKLARDALDFRKMLKAAGTVATAKDAAEPGFHTEEQIQSILATAVQTHFAQPDLLGNLPVHYAAAAGTAESVPTLQKLLATGGVHLLATKNSQGFQAIHFAAQNCGVPIFQVILEAGDVHQLEMKSDSNRETPIHLAAMHNPRFSVMKYILETGGVSQLQYKTPSGQIPMHYAAQGNPNVDILELMVAMGGLEQLHVRDAFGRLPLHHAASFNPNLDVLKFLLGADLRLGQPVPIVLDTTDYGPKIEALEEEIEKAKEAQDLELLRMMQDDLIETMTSQEEQVRTTAIIKAKNRALLTDPEQATDHFGDAPIHAAAAHNPSAVILTHLLEKGGITTQVTMKNNKGEQPIHRAAASNPSVEVMKALLHLGDRKQLEARDAAGNIPMHCCTAFQPNVEIFNCIYQAGGPQQIVTKNEDNERPIHSAAQYTSNLVLLERLLEVGGSGQLMMQKGKAGHGLEQPVHVAALHNPSVGVMRILLQVGDDNGVEQLEERTTSGMLPMHFAAMSSANLDVLRFLLTDARDKAFGAEQLFDRDRLGRMPIHYAAASNDSVEAMTTILSHGGKHQLTMEDRYMNRPIHRAAEFNMNVAVVAHMLKSGPPPESQELDNMAASVMGSGATFDPSLAILDPTGVIIAYGPDCISITGGIHLGQLNPQLMWQDNDMELPVHYAARNPVVDVLGHILEVGGAKRLLSAKDNSDRQAIHHAAVFNENKEMLQYILKVGGARRFSRTGWKRSSPSKWCVRLDGLAEYCGDEMATPEGVARSRVGLVVGLHPGGASKVKLQWLSDGTRSDWLPVVELFEPNGGDDAAGGGVE